MNILTKIVRIVGWAWIAVAGLVLVGGFAMILFKRGFGAFRDTLNPYDIRNFITVILVLAPGLVLLQLAEAIQRRLRGKCVAMLLALPITIGIMILMFAIANRSDVADEKWAEAVDVKDRSWRADACSDYWMTSACGEIKGFDDAGQLPAVIRVGDVVNLRDKNSKELIFPVRNISVFTYSKDIDTVFPDGKRSTAKKGDTSCFLYDESSRSKIEANAMVSKIVVKNCRKVASAGGTASATTTDLKNALAEYAKAVGVFPKEFLQFSAVQQEAYIRGVLDGEIALLEVAKDPMRDGVVTCLNVRLGSIISEAKSFVQSEGEDRYPMPWTLSRLVGKTCPKDTRISTKNSPEYTEAATSLKLTPKEFTDDADSQKKQDAIDKAFVRGVLDGKVFTLHGYGYPKLVVYLDCLSKPDSLDTIFRGMRAAQAVALNLHKSQAYNVAQGEAIACKDLNE